MKNKIIRIEIALKEARIYYQDDSRHSPSCLSFISNPIIPDKYEGWVVDENCVKIEVDDHGINIWNTEHEIIFYPFENIIAYKKWTSGEFK